MITSLISYRGILQFINTKVWFFFSATHIQWCCLSIYDTVIKWIMKKFCKNYFQLPFSFHSFSTSLSNQPAKSKNFSVVVLSCVYRKSLYYFIDRWELWHGTRLRKLQFHLQNDRSVLCRKTKGVKHCSLVVGLKSREFWLLN